MKDSYQQPPLLSFAGKCTAYFIVMQIFLETLRFVNICLHLASETPKI